jgi:MinD superfamily P-loop ATPase
MLKMKQENIKRKYYFYLNPYNEHGLSCSKCPKCDGKTKIKKIPLAIMLEKGKATLNLNKTCKYCHYCELLIAKKCEIESFLEQFEEAYNRDTSDFFVLGTMDKKAFAKTNGKGPIKAEDSKEAFDAITTFKNVWNFKITGGWVKDG